MSDYFCHKLISKTVYLKKNQMKGTTSKPHSTVQWFKFNDNIVDLVDENEVFVAIHTDIKTGTVRTPYILLNQRESD